MSDPNPEAERAEAIASGMVEVDGEWVPAPCAANNCGDESVGTGDDGQPYCRVHYREHNVDVGAYQEAEAERMERQEHAAEAAREWAHTDGRNNQ
jgi:hypothetical protein